MLILVAISGRSFRLPTANARPPVICVKSASRDGPNLLFRGGTAARLEQADRVNLNIRFPGVLADVRFACTGYDYRLRPI